MAGKLEALVRVQRYPVVGVAAKYLLLLRGVAINPRATVGRDLRLAHGALGAVVHGKTRIGDRVTIYQGVTVGRRGVDMTESEEGFDGVVIEDDVVLGAGAKVLGGRGTLVVGRGTVVGANAVLLESTGPDEVWVGIPARCVGRRGRSGVTPDGSVQAGDTPRD